MIAVWLVGQKPNLKELQYMYNVVVLSMASKNLLICMCDMSCENQDKCGNTCYFEINPKARVRFFVYARLLSS